LSIVPRKTSDIERCEALEVTDAHDFRVGRADAAADKRCGSQTAGAGEQLPA
jgi:hypothetical protein